MPISNITNGESGSSVRASLNETINAVNALGNSANLNVGATAGTVCAGDDSRLSNARTPTAHATTHTNGTDDIQSATASQNGLATSTQIAKLDGIETGADVTDAANVGSSIGGATVITTIGDTDQLPVVQTNVLKSITYLALKALLGAIYQAKATILSTFSSLSNSSGVLTNDGAGNLSWQTAGGTGDVVGPASATDNAIARFDATTGKLIQNSGITIADGATGALSGTNTGDQTITLTGDVTGSGTGSFATTLATVNSNVGSFGSATAAPAITVNAKGLITAATTNTITPAVGNITGLGTGVAAALAANVGSAGAPVLFNGAAGTPGSGTLTNCTGLPLTTGVTGDLPFANLTPATAASKLLGRGSASGAGDYEEITVGSGLTMTGTTLSASGGSGGKVAQVVYTEDATAKSATTTIPNDNTIPQNTEGTEYTEINTTITPTNASSRLEIHALISDGISASGTLVFALFKDSDADAKAVQWHTLGGSGFAGQITLYISLTAGSTSAQTFKVRFGRANGTPTVYINQGGSAVFGGKLISSMTVTEILP